MRRTNHAIFLTRGAIIAALYVLLTLISSLFGMASGVIQVRISEALCVLPVFFAEAVPGLAIGCLIANLLTGAVVWDVVFGACATLIGAIGARLIARLAMRFGRWLEFLIPLPTVAANALIVPFVLIYAYGATEAYPFILFTVSVGEIISAWVLGLVLLGAAKRIFK